MKSNRGVRRAGAVALAALLAAPAWAKHGADDPAGDDRGGTRSDATCSARTISELVASTGLDADGTARARWRQDSRCRADFSVELEDVPAGDYVLVVGGVVRGTIAVRALPTGGTEGEIEFEAVDDTPHPLTLTFDPLDAVIEIRAGGAIWFADVFDGIGTAPATTPTAVRTRTPLPTVRTTPTAARTIGATRTRTRTIAAARTATAPRATRTATPVRSRTGSSGSSTQSAWARWTGWIISR